MRASIRNSCPGFCIKFKSMWSETLRSISAHQIPRLSVVASTKIEAYPSPPPPWRKSMVAVPSPARNNHPLMPSGSSCTDGPSKFSMNWAWASVTDSTKNESQKKRMRKIFIDEIVRRSAKRNNKVHDYLPALIQAVAVVFLTSLVFIQPLFLSDQRGNSMRKEVTPVNRGPRALI